MSAITITKHVKAERSAVFQAFVDIEHAADRIDAIKAIEIVSEQKSGLGMRWRETRTMFGKETTEEMEISEFTENQSYSVVGVSCGTEILSRFTFEDADGDTQVTFTIDAKPLTIFAKLMSPLCMFMTGPIKKAIEGDMNAIKDFVESESTLDVSD